MLLLLACLSLLGCMNTSRIRARKVCLILTGTAEIRTDTGCTDLMFVVIG